MKRRILALLVALCLVALVGPAVVFAADTDAVECTVSATLVAVEITTDGTVTYGTLDLSATKNTLSGELNDTQTAKNTGTVDEIFKIKSTDATSGGTNWVLAATIDADQFKHEFSIDSTFPGTAMTPKDTYFTLAASIAPNGEQSFDLQITMPSSATDYQQHDITVTVLAEEA